MPDQYGLLPIPVPGTGLIGDPFLELFGDYLKTVVNANVGTAWATLRPRTGEEALPVRAVFTNDPAKVQFVERQLPAIFLWRDRETIDRKASDRRHAETKLKVLWVFPPDGKQALKARWSPFCNAVAKTIDAALEFGRHPLWVASGDTNPTATSYAEDTRSIVLPFATSTSPVVVSGAGLDGDIGADLMSPRREVTITTTSVGGSVYETGADVVVSAEDWYGQTVSFLVRLTLAGGGETVRIGEDVKRVISVSLPAMLTTGGTIEVGTSAVEGRGSVVPDVLGLARLPELNEWMPATVTIDIFDDEGRRSDSLKYDAIQFNLASYEKFEEAQDSRAYQPHGLDFSVFIDGFKASSAALPDDSE